MSKEQKKSVLRYMLPAVALGVFAFLMVIYGSAYSPPKPQRQQVICYKFKAGVSEEAVKAHIAAFNNLKGSTHQIVGYSAGETTGSTQEYDVMHHLIFRNDADMQKFIGSSQYQSFVKANEGNWEKTLVINSEIK